MALLISSLLGKVGEICTDSFHNNCEQDNSSGKYMTDNIIQCKQKHPEAEMDGRKKNILSNRKRCVSNS